MNHRRRLRDRLSRPEILVTPGGYDALSAVLIEQHGFDAMYLSGASIAYTRLGRPDLGLVGLSELGGVMAAIRERVDLPVIVDADTGFGNALNVARTVRHLEQKGASAIQLEDQRLPKRCGHLPGKTVVSTGEMVGKLKAALDARQDPDLLIVARTDALAVEGESAALDRAEQYRDVGADLLFVEAPGDRDQMQRVCDRLAPGGPLLANMVEGGKSPDLDASSLQAMGYRVVIFPGAMVRAQSHATRAFLTELAEHGTTRGFSDRMFNFAQLNELLGTQDLMDLAERYAEDEDD